MVAIDSLGGDIDCHVGQAYRGHDTNALIIRTLQKPVGAGNIRVRVGLVKVFHSFKARPCRVPAQHRPWRCGWRRRGQQGRPTEYCSVVNAHRFSYIFSERDASRICRVTLNTPGFVEDSVKVAIRQTLRHCGGCAMPSALRVREARAFPFT
eukprot:scaffold5063_cov127-Isochrysis_galbana.AAC.1